MIRINQIVLTLNQSEDSLLPLVARTLGVAQTRITEFHIVRRSIDARKKNNIRQVYSVDVALDYGESMLVRQLKNKNIARIAPVSYTLNRTRLPEQRPVVVGSGPAGLFAALVLAQAGARPIVLERGKAVNERIDDVERFHKSGVLDENSNIQFGEGGAGTFSDGKLTTGINDPRIQHVLKTFVAAGAPPEIAYNAKPHIGTDYLVEVVKNLREQITALGGEVRFSHQLISLVDKNGRINAVRVKKPNGEETIETEHVILAIGHSARDTFEMLYTKGLMMEQKAFSVGARIEHKQSFINRAQYGSFATHSSLGAADYKLSMHLLNKKGVYTFCMCPGGQVVAAASELGSVVTNGMSRFHRDGENANSALLVSVGPEDFGGDHPLAGIYYQRSLERSAFSLGGSSYRAPAQLVGDFLQGCRSTILGKINPTYPLGVVLSDLRLCLPADIVSAMQYGLRQFNQQIPGFSMNDAVLTGVETRSSSPVRILRDKSGQSSLRGVYPCGEGGGYAGGIMSAAVDGMKAAEAVLGIVQA